MSASTSASVLKLPRLRSTALGRVAVALWSSVWEETSNGPILIEWVRVT